LFAVNAHKLPGANVHKLPGANVIALVLFLEKKSNHRRFFFSYRNIM